MRTMNQDVIKNAQKFAARWGFLTQDLFYDFICKMSLAQSYRYWRYLVQSGLFVASKASPYVLLLSRKSRQEMSGMEARPSRLPMYVQHDSAVARFILLIQETGLVDNFWLEDELLRNKLLGYQILGAERIDRIPDLIFDLKTPDGILRSGLEIEKTTKTQARYSKMALAYQGYKNIGLVLMGCGSLFTEVAVKRGFKFPETDEGRKVPGIFEYPYLQVIGLKTTVRFAENEFSLAQLLEVVTKQSVQIAESKRNLNENAISFRNRKNAEAV